MILHIAITTIIYCDKVLWLSQFSHIYHSHRSHDYIIQEKIIEGSKIDNIIQYNTILTL